MRKLILTAVLILGLANLAFAAAEWQENGVKVNKSEAVNFKNGPDVSGNGTVTDVDFATQTGDQTLTGTLTVDGSGYGPTLTVDNGAAVSTVVAGSFTVDPCPTLGAGAIFFNATKGAPCFCNKLEVDLSLYDGTTACF